MCGGIEIFVVVVHCGSLVVALCFMEIWNRRQSELQYDWDVADFEIEEVGYSSV